VKFIGRGRFSFQSAGAAADAPWIDVGAVSDFSIQFALCPWCEESILPSELFRSLLQSGAARDYHEECAVRMIVGSAAHQLQECSCFLKTGARHDPPGISKREAAKLAFDCFRARVGL
jgi:hypothetical protein